MAGWREKKRRALARIHKEFEHDAVYLTHAAGNAVAVKVRLHLKQIVGEQQIDDWTSAGKMLDLHSRIIFKQSEVATPLPRTYVVFSPTEAYIVGPSKPERETYVWCEVSECPAPELRALLNATDRENPAWGDLLTGFIPDPPQPVDP